MPRTEGLRDPDCSGDAKEREPGRSEKGPKDRCCMHPSSKDACSIYPSDGLGPRSGRRPCSRALRPSSPAEAERASDIEPGRCGRAFRWAWCGGTTGRRRDLCGGRTDVAPRSPRRVGTYRGTPSRLRIFVRRTNDERVDGSFTERMSRGSSRLAGPTCRTLNRCNPIRPGTRPGRISAITSGAGPSASRRSSGASPFVAASRARASRRDLPPPVDPVPSRLVEPRRARRDRAGQPPDALHSSGD
jgi:hypothetical protein